MTENFGVFLFGIAAVAAVLLKHSRTIHVHDGLDEQEIMSYLAVTAFVCMVTVSWVAGFLIFEALFTPIIRQLVATIGMIGTMVNWLLVGLFFAVSTLIGTTDGKK